MLSTTRLIVCICGLPLLLLWAAFMVCYTPIYTLIKLFTPSKTEHKIETKTVEPNRPGLLKLSVNNA